MLQVTAVKAERLGEFVERVPELLLRLVLRIAGGFDPVGEQVALVLSELFHRPVIDGLAGGERQGGNEPKRQQGDSIHQGHGGN